MKRALQILAAIAAAADAIAVLDLKGIVSLLPDGWAVWVAGVPSAAAVVVHLINAFRSNLERLEKNETETTTETK